MPLFFIAVTQRSYIVRNNNVFFHTNSEGNKNQSQRKEIIMEKIFKDVNEFEIRGRILRIFHRKGFLQVTISATSRTEHRDYPRIVMYGDEADATYERLAERDFVVAKGECQYSRTRHVQNLVASSIQPGIMDAFDSVGDARNRQQNIVKLRGEFVRVFYPESANGNIALMTIRCTTHGYTNYLNVTAFGKVAERVKKFKEGDRVAFVGSVQTHKTESNGETQYHQDVVGAIVPCAD